MIYSIIAIALIIASILLVTFNVIKAKWYAWAIYFAGLFTAYSTTMPGFSVVGTDISRELLMSNLAFQNGWDLSRYDPSNTSVVVGWMIPQLSKLTTIEPVWIYKVFLPVIFALTPVFLYFIFRKMIGELKAFYASMFFIIVPVFALEIATIGKSMVAEPLMALTLLVMFTDWKQKYRFLVMLPLVILTLWAHYTVGILLCMYLGGIVFVQFFIRKWWKSSLYWRYLVSIIVVGATFFWAYYSQVAQGLVWTSSTGIFHYNFSQSLTEIKQSVTNSENVSKTVQAYSLIKSAFGLDIGQLTWSGIAFRLVQVLTQVLVVVGFLWMLFKSKFAKNGILFYRFKAEYVAGCFVAFALLGLCVIVPTFASLINATRQYHMALLFLSPCFVLAFDAVENGWKWNIK
jgi:uncharacterized membrane protein